MTKGNLERDSEREAVLRRIAHRWSSVETLRAWAKVEPDLRRRVLAELDESLRQRDVEGAERAAFVAAADALDAIPLVLDLFGIHAAADDVGALPEMAKR